MCAGTRSGGLKARDANLAKNPNFYREIGRKGGRNGNTGGFAYAAAHGLNWHVEAGRKGGTKSRRGPNQVKQVAIEPKKTIMDRAKEILHVR